MIADNHKDELFQLLMKHGGDWGENQIPKELETLILTGRVM
jgi:hypothetical protein